MRILETKPGPDFWSRADDKQLRSAPQSVHVVSTRDAPAMHITCYTVFANANVTAPVSVEAYTLRVDHEKPHGAQSVLITQGELMQVVDVITGLIRMVPYVVGFMRDTAAFADAYFTEASANIWIRNSFNLGYRPNFTLPKDDHDFRQRPIQTGNNYRL